MSWNAAVCINLKDVAMDGGVWAVNLVSRRKPAAEAGRPVVAEVHDGLKSLLRQNRSPAGANDLDLQRGAALTRCRRCLQMTRVQQLYRASMQRLVFEQPGAAPSCHFE